MDSYKRIAKLKIQAAQERAHAVLGEVARVENKVYVSPGSQNVVEFVGDAARRIDGRLEMEQAVVDADLLDPPELETRIHRVTSLIPFLHILLGFVEGSDVHHSPGQLLPTLRRYTRSIFPASEIVISSKPELNYAIQDIAGPLRKMFSGTSVEASCALLPELLFMVNIPAAESGQILIHGVVSHELGHALYDRQEMAKKLLPKIKLNESLVKGLTSTMYENQLKQGHPTPELRLRKQITQEITARVNGWVKELSSDAIGIYLFGPALFFSAVHLLTSFGHLDESSDTHPAPRLRVKLMIRMLKQLYTVEQWRPELQSYLADWDSVSAAPVKGTNPYDQLALETINDAALDLISQESQSATATTDRYSTERFVRDTNEFSRLLLSHIPPGEAGPYSNATSVGLASIINAGWHVYLCDFEAFRKTLHPNDARTRYTTAAKLHELVLKALEISGIRMAWEEAKVDSKLGKN
ncbi:MAG TPA: hypothetical protein VEO56_09040 [Bacteroidota bacterium]|nr:hypothetical protein [Bacteroidota bacterium]